MNRYQIQKEKAHKGDVASQGKYALPLPEDYANRCASCPYPSVGFICWSTDGSCMRTDINKIHCQRKGG